MLADHMKARGITEAELAAKLGVSQSYANRLKNRPVNKLPLKRALEIHDKLNLRVGLLEDATDEEIAAFRRVAEAS